MSRPAPRVSFVPALLFGLTACGAALGFGGCTSGSGGFADPAAVEEAAALTGEPMPIDEWTTDLAAAKQTAEAENKDLLLLFTGSDWCPPCMALEKEVFAKSPASRLQDDFVPVLLDFPMQKPQAPEIVARNEEIQESFGVTGYPTVLLVSASGEQYAELHYEERYASGGPAAFLADAKAKRNAHGGAGSEPSVVGGAAAAE
ncbi:thioredoxin family protein [Alienimonas chondri]|uniref:Thioredoxin domain-containing protein n=1 Tax=Alienimonas chondri TaxID=2681879 RepID=A0ABX1VFB4_9PLAN|nr:thioredoxin family protein [Alienimonas chondri]NNJ26803.1 hypothetical protein [Alienimonas chondri]